MGWYIRKSFNVGPLRFNLSKNGIGTSVGTRGYRLGKKPNGKRYVHAGRHGLYFRQNLDSKNDSNIKTFKPNPQLYNKDGNGSGCLSVFIYITILAFTLSCLF